MDVLKFAMEVDRSGRDFYRLLATRAATPGARQIFLRMAEDEERLLESYHQMRMGEGRLAASEALEAAENPYSHAGTPPGSGELAAYRLVLEMEGKVCRLLESAAGRETEPAARNLLRQVAAVECGEFAEIESVVDFINAPNEYLAWGEFSNLDEFHNFGRYEDNRGCGHTH